VPRSNFLHLLGAILNCCILLFVVVENSTAQLPVDKFKDGIKHYRDGSGQRDYARFKPEQIVEIADNILLHQRNNGGWPSNWDPLRILSNKEIQAIRRDRGKLDTTFDNRSTYPQIEYLSHAFLGTGEEPYRQAVLKGLEFVFSAQYENGGFPHSYPSQSNYRPHITFNDDSMVGVLSMLRRVATGAKPFEWIPEELKIRAVEAVRRGDECILRTQVVVDGQRMIWPGQVDKESLQPTQARSYELPSLMSAESVGVVRYLMGVDCPNPEIRRAIESAVRWFEQSKIEGIRIQSVSNEPVRYNNHTATTDRIVVEDPNAPPIWARFYEIGTNRPFMANRDGTKVYSLAEVHHERRTGYGWYTTSPNSLLEDDYPKWRAKWVNGSQD
jgi:PelA/Pel-15E family pectate lyase